jgi:hypothetical protein
MPKTIRKRLSYANVVATLALVFAMSGGALAANHYLINSTKQINPKVLKKLKGRAGVNGAPGAPGAQGKVGPLGKEGSIGPRGPGVGDTASASSGFKEQCTLGPEDNYCYLPATAFTPSTDERCLVSIDSQIFGFTTPVAPGNEPYFLVAIKTGASDSNDGGYGFYFQRPAGETSTSLSRTRLLAVKAGTTYNFGAYYRVAAGQWEGKHARFNVTYTCFA